MPVAMQCKAPMPGCRMKKSHSRFCQDSHFSNREPPRNTIKRKSHPSQVLLLSSLRVLPAITFICRLLVFRHIHVFRKIDHPLTSLLRKKFHQLLRSGRRAGSDPQPLAHPFQAPPSEARLVPLAAGRVDASLAAPSHSHHPLIMVVPGSSPSNMVDWGRARGAP